MDDLIDAINALALGLLDRAQELETLIDDPNPNVESIKSNLETICNTLTSVIEHLVEHEASPLRRLLRMIDEAKVSHSLNRVAKYVADHRATLIKLQVPESVIESVVSTLTGEASHGDNALDKPQTLRLEYAIDPLRTFRDAVCDIANATEVADIISRGENIRQIAKGTIGAATVVLDITGAVAASPFDPVGWVLLKAVKSVWAGGSVVNRATKEIASMV